MGGAARENLSGEIHTQQPNGRSEMSSDIPPENSEKQSLGSSGSYPREEERIVVRPTTRRPSFNMTLDVIDNKRQVSIKEELQTKRGDVLTLIPKRTRSAVSMRADDTDNWGQDTLDDREDFQLVLRDPTVKNELLERLNTFRINRELCDVVLFVREREIFAHKVVLGAVSPALFDMFVKEDTESSNGSSTPSTPANPLANGHPLNFTQLKNKQAMAYFEFSSTDYDCFDALVNFAYTAYLEIGSKKVAELYKTAFALQMEPVVRACATFLADNISVKNCIGIRRQANFNNDIHLMGKVDRFITENFEKVVNDSVEFTQLPCVKIRVIGSADEIKTTDEKGDTMALRALDYFDHLPHDRVEHSLDILTCKTHLLYLEEDERLADCAEMDDRSSVGSCDIVKDYKRSGKDVARAVTSDSAAVAPIQHRINGAVPVRLNASRMPNVKYNSTESLDSVGTEESDPQETIETRLVATHQTAPDYYVSLVVLYRRLVVLSIQLTQDDELTKPRTNSGGDPSSALLNRLISSTGSQRTPLATMSGARCSIGASFVNGKIVVCGGYDRGECLKTVEEYDPVKGEWRSLKSMKDERGRFDSAVLNGKVYAVAGSNGNHDLKSCEMYDPKMDKWEAIPSLGKARSHNGCAAIDGYIYCIGGSSDQTVLGDCERFTEGMQVWEQIPSMEHPRYQAGVIAWRGLVVACGGCDRWACMDTVEAYDPKIGNWRQLAKLRQPRRGCAVAVVRDSLYVIGGHDGSQSLSSVEVLDHPSASWRPGPSLTIPRANTHAVVTAGNVIYAIGGFNGNQFLNSIELLESEAVGFRNWQQTGGNNSELLEEEEIDEMEKKPQDSVAPAVAAKS